jgi:uncharacterized protein YkwD
VAATTTTVAATTTTVAATTTTVAATTTTVAATTTTAQAGGYDPAAEGQFFASINGVRAGAGVPALQADGGLASYARGWARSMAESGVLGHSDVSSLLGPWGAVGENVGMGHAVGPLFDALVASSGHYANMVDGSFTHLGVGVWVDDEGTIWTVHVFAG